MKYAAAILIFITAAIQAQQPLVLLDPARGGSQPGAHIADGIDETEVTLNLAQRLASLLRARGFAVELTREADVDVSNDARAALANTTHPVACILLHATPAGAGVHLFTTAQRQSDTAAGSPIRWNQAQAAYAERSRTLRDDLKVAFPRSKINATGGQTWMRPLDNMQCPAVAVEVAPRKDGGDTAGDTSYQAQIASAIANTLLLWRGKLQATLPPEPALVPPQPKPAVKPSVPLNPDPSAEIPSQQP